MAIVTAQRMKCVSESDFDDVLLVDHVVVVIAAESIKVKTL